MSSIFLIDGHAYAYQAFFALRQLHAPDGTPTNAVFGFMKLIQKILKEKHPEYMAVCFDAGKPTFRHSIYKDYKCTRKPMPESMQLQLPIIKEILGIYNIPVFEKEGFEADDLMATLAVKSEKEGLYVYLVTLDKDIGQVVNDKIQIYDSKKHISMDAGSIKEKFQIEPSQLPEYFALVGDAVDDIPGVTGIGPKKAVELISQWKSLEQVYENLEQIKPDKIRKILLEHKEDAFLSKKLFLLDKNVDIPFDLQQCIVSEADLKRLAALYKRLGFKSLLAQEQNKAKEKQEKLDENATDTTSETEEGNSDVEENPQTNNEVNPQKNDGSEPAQIEIPSETVKDKDKLLELVSFLHHQEKVTMELEAEGDGGNVWDSQIDAFIFAWSEKTTYIPLTSDSRDNFLEILRPVLEDGPTKYCHDLKKIVKILWIHGINLYPLGFDTMLVSYLLNPENKQDTLERLSSAYLSLSIQEEPPEADRVHHFCMRAWIIQHLLEKLEKLMDEHEIRSLTNDVEIPLVPVLAEMELTGICLDIEVLRELDKDITVKLRQMEREIYNCAGQDFNISAPKQLGQILFEKLQLPKGKKTKTGYSTSVEVLEELKNSHPLPGMILEHRKLSKLANTYVEVLPALLNPKTNRIHTSFDQTGTATGRISSLSPNLQNIPVRTEMGSQIRKAFVASSGHQLLTADYSQIELRILAHFSADPRLTEAFLQDMDIHTSVASSIFGVPDKEVTREQRRTAKTVNFGIIYGQTPYGLSRELGIGMKEAKAFIEAYFKQYTRVKEFIEEILEEAREKGYVTTILNRRRYLPDIGSANHTIRKFAERTAVNTVMQGSAADIIKKAMVNIYQKRKEKMLNFKILLQIHDELIFEVPENDMAEIKNLVCTEMLQAVPLQVPLKVNAAIGKNWLEIA